ncbi:MAG: FAD-dependent oxidoreductase [Acidipropionibacterium sp.]|jgi:protoporphyrinogen oxidase|nr:FAD-dependent oxidoreductase [Acidipropionibacterium sp.]
MTSSEKIVIVGGGCAGLSAAYTLQEAGLDYVLLEAGDRVGGRVGNRTNGDSTWAIGATMTEPQWETTAQYLDEFGLLEQVRKIRTQCFGMWDGQQTRYLTLGRGMRPAQLWHFLRGALPASTYLQAIRFGATVLPHLVKAGPASRKYDLSWLTRLQAITTAEFGRRHGGPEFTDRILGPFLATMVLGRTTDVSIALPLATLALMRGMRTLEGGMAVITDALHERVRGRVRLSTPVEEILVEDGAVVGVRTSGSVIPTRTVICATDAQVARRIIPALPERMADDLSVCTYSSTYNYVFGLDRRIVPDNFVSLMIPESENSVLLRVFDENSGAFGSRGPRGSGLMHAFTAGWHDDTLMAMDEADRRRVVITEMQRFFPGFPDEPAFTDVIRWDRALCQQSPAQLEAMTDLRGHLNDVAGLRLAGEYLFVNSTTEGALLTGRRAAEQVIG